ncbi:hypothetical protein A3D77_04625 [Candidatus Gottesmanbacteria bacterium RIFCSPHIGHO2_02_FULL_39_11]|uniref:Glycosyl transferase family 1 domain-containing protein n=1 Tax=Candidatus Gottesmanbacteria bacterium RIFCSPHIGHO2_02_FULL_39_11 TaxID=1798382 RepID=A0A1F5ZJU2_9BACT|nr:MAG: hypothetical protein A3D77_04625 [Candidatus Gottesmanbacteria bacterium RIFCSPHIGHO2_02_FULL_39_11]
MNIKTLMRRPETFFVCASLGASFLNFIYNAFLGRVLTFEEFGIITLFNSLLYVVGILLNAFTGTVNHRVAYLSGSVSRDASISYYRRVFKRGVAISVGITLLWLIFSPFLASYFRVSSVVPFLFYTPVLSLGIVYACQKGFLQGMFYFGRTGVVQLVEAVSKLVLAALIVALGFVGYVYLSIPASVTIAFIVTTILSFSFLLRKNETHTYAFGRKYFTASILTGFSMTAFLTFDLILVKHFLSPRQAGEYSLISLVGKMIYFLGSIPNAFMVSYVSKIEGQGKNTLSVFYRIYAMTSLIIVSVFLLLGPLGVYSVPIFFGSKTSAILSFLPTYCFAIAMFSLTNTIVSYHIAKRQFIFSGIAILFSIILIISINFFHSDISEIVNVITSISGAYLFTVILFHFLERNGEFVLRNLVDIYSAFRPLEKIKIAKGKKRILIFNWRDTKHVFAGGAEVYIHELAKRWVSDGHRVTLFCGNDGMNLRYEMVDGVEVYRRGGFYFVYCWAFLYYFTQFRGRYDVVIDSQNGIPFFTPLFVREKVYCLMHHVHQEVFRKSLRFPIREFAQTLENSVMPWVYRHTRFITVSQSTKEDMVLMGLTGAGIDILPPGVDLTKYKPGQKSKNPLVLYMGRLKHYKRVNIFIRMANEIIEKIPNAKFIIAGEGEKREGLEKLAKELALGDAVKFLGKVTEQEKISLYQKAWVVVNPSMMEGFGITSIEANACATPVVASNVPGLRDSVRNPHTGFLVSAFKVDQYTEKTLLLIKEKPLREKFRKKSIAWANRFNWDSNCKKFISLLSK